MSIKIEKLLIKNGDKKLVDISFEIDSSFALVGQSGSGKSLTLKALLGMLPANLEYELEVDSGFELKRGASVAIVVQNPFTALSPMTKIKDQFFISENSAKELMRMVELDESLLQRYPSELSGGQLQRVVIALALALKPKLLLLDEPTTALDHNTKDSIISLLVELQKNIGYKILFVTHDIDLVKKICQKIAILKNGIIVERGDVEAVLLNPKDDYTKELIASNFKNRERRL